MSNTINIKIDNKKTSNIEKKLKKQNDKKYWKKLFSYYYKYKLAFIPLIITCTMYTILATLLPIFEGKMLGAFEDFNINMIIKFATSLFVIKALANIFDFFWEKTIVKLDYNVNFDIKMDILDAMMNLETKNYDNTSSGVFLSRLNHDSYELSELVDYISSNASGIVVNFMFIFYIFYLNYWLGLFMIIYIGSLYLINSNKLKRQKKARQYEKEVDEANCGTYNDIIRGIREIKNLNLKGFVKHDIIKKEEQAIAAKTKTSMIRVTWSRARTIFSALLDLSFVMLSLYLISNKSLSISSFLIIFLYKNKLLNLVQYISNIHDEVSKCSVAAKRTFDIITYSEYSKESFGTEKLTNPLGTIKFNNVSFKYNSDGKIIFKDLNFTIPKNKITAIVGKSGEGKSTILKMITKGYEITDGDIFIDDVNLRDISEESLKSAISVVSQVPYIFNLSILDNIKLANPYATLDNIIKVCKKAQLHDFIEKMPKGYDTIVGENGVILSGGQKQRLAIARALIKNSKIILLDEATSALDNQNQEKIKDVIADLSHDHTIIIVAHRLSTIVDADNIIVLNNHQIIASGRHNDLIKKCDIYKNLYNIEDANDMNDYE